MHMNCIGSKDLNGLVLNFKENCFPNPLIKDKAYSCVEACTQWHNFPEVYGMENKKHSCNQSKMTVKGGLVW